jgi:peptidoglycan/LPS O-acetylase OafA/YrhL
MQVQSYKRCRRNVIVSSATHVIKDSCGIRARRRRDGIDMHQTDTTMTRSLAVGIVPSASTGTITDRVCEIRTDIEALRALAILLVVAFHCRIVGIPGGFVGVDVFYVLSGYLITGLLVAEVDRTSRLSLLQFYARRVRRLLPAASLVLLVTLLFGAMVLAPQELNLTARAARATALYVSNLFFARSAADYFSARVTFNPLLHTWSLAVEEQFYLLWPCLIFLGLLVWRSKRALLGMVIGLTVLSFTCCVWLTRNHRVFAFYGLPTRAWEFGIGGLAMLLPRGRPNLSKPAWIAIGWLGGCLIVGSSLLITSAMSFPGWLALFPVAGTALTLISGAEQPHRGVGALFDAAPLQKLGALSYSWYLWHWPFLVFTAALIPGASQSARVLAAAASLAVAQVTHQYFENPIRRSPRLMKHPTLSLALGAAAVAVCLAAAVQSQHFANDLADVPQLKALAETRADFAEMPRRQCIASDGSSAPKTCTFGSTTSTTNIVLFGDSHAAQWFDALDQLVLRKHWKLTTVVKLGCTAVDVNPGLGIDEDPECTVWRNEAIRDILVLRPSLIIMGSATNKLERPENPEAHAGAALIAEVREGVLRTLRPLNAAGLRVALLRDTPEFPFDVTSCLARATRHSWYPKEACEMPRAAVLDPGIYAAEKSAADGLSNVRFIDLTDQLCPQSVCKTILNGLVMYRDTHHLAGKAAASLAPAFDPQVLGPLSLADRAEAK